MKVSYNLKKIFSALMFLAFFIAGAQQPLKFREGGTFKILQFTDVHWSNDPKFTDETEKTIRAEVQKEKPDLIIFTGDNVNCIPMKSGWENLGKIVEESATPWTLVFGNHDEEQDWSKSRSLDFLKTFPHFFAEKGSVHGVINCSVPIFSHDGKKTAAYLFLMDSGDYTRNPNLGTYDWIRQNQVNWYAEESQKHLKKDGKILPSLMFFHIPLPEYAAVAKDPATVGDNKDDVSSSEINSGMAAAVLEQKNVEGIFCGHDHDNNFIGNYKGIALAYGSKTGTDGYGTLEHGARAIILKEGKFAFDTYISTPKTMKYRYSYPSGLPIADASTKFLKSEKVSPKNHGLNFVYFEGNVSSAKDIEKLKMVKSGITAQPGLSEAVAEDHFGLKFSGYIKVPETGFYKFYTYSDDGSLLKIDGQTVVDNDGGHSAARKEGSVALEKGFHKIEILYFEDYMGQILEAGISSLEIPEQPLPAEMLYSF